jgi:hypothetical protein
MAEKEKEFSQVKSSVFREVAIYLVLAYEKTLEDNFMDAITDLYHCYTLMGNPEILTWCAETRNEELNPTLIRGRYNFSEMKRKRKYLLYDKDEVTTGKHLPVKDDDDGEIINTSKPPKHIAREETGSSDVELVGSNINALKATKAKKTTDLGGFEGGGAAGLSAECMLKVTNSEIKNQQVESFVREMNKYPDISDFQNDKALREEGGTGSLSEVVCEKASVDVQKTWVLQCKEADGDIHGKIIDSEKEYGNMCDIKTGSHKQGSVAVSEGSEKRNQDALNNDKVQKNIMQETECKNTARDSENEKRIREDSKSDKQTQRMAAMEYVVNATVAYVAYFSESSQEAYKLAKYTEHM